jgi:hypothetical protein
MSSQKIQYQVRFSEEVEFRGQKMQFNDALYYTELPPQEEIDKAKEERVRNWLTVLEAPPVEVEVTEEQLLQEQQQLDEQIASLEARKLECVSKVAEISAKKIIDVKPIGERLGGSSICKGYWWKLQRRRNLGINSRRWGDCGGSDFI